MAPNAQEFLVLIRHSSRAKMFLVKVNNILFYYTYHQCPYNLSKPSGDSFIKANLTRLILLVFLLDHIANFRKYLKELEVEKFITIVSISSILLIGNMFSRLFDLLYPEPGIMYSNLNCARVLVNLWLISLFWFFFFLTIALCIASLYMSSKVAADGFRQIYIFWLFLLVNRARYYIVIFGAASFTIILGLPYVNLWLDYAESIGEDRCSNKTLAEKGNFSERNGFWISLVLICCIYLFLLLATFYVSYHLVKNVQRFENSLLIATEHKLILYSIDAGSLAQSGPIDTKTINRIIDDTWEKGCDCIRCITAADYNNILNKYLFGDDQSYFFRITYHVVGFWKFKCMARIEKLQVAENPSHVACTVETANKATDPMHYNRIKKTFKKDESFYQVSVVEHPKSYTSYNYVDYVKHYNRIVHTRSIGKRIMDFLCCDCGYSQGSASKYVDIVKSTRRFIQVNDMFQHNTMITYVLHLLKKPYPVMSLEYVQNNFTQFVDISQEVKKHGVDGIDSLDLFRLLEIELELPSRISEQLHIVEKERKILLKRGQFLQQNNETIMPWPVKLTGNFSYIAATLQVVFCIKAHMDHQMGKVVQYRLFSRQHWTEIEKYLKNSRPHTTQAELTGDKDISASPTPLSAHPFPGYLEHFFEILTELYHLRKHTVTPNTLFNVRYLFAQQRNTRDKLKSRLEHDPTDLFIKFTEIMFFGDSSCICCRFVTCFETEPCKEIYGLTTNGNGYREIDFEDHSHERNCFHENKCGVRRFITVKVHQTQDISKEEFESAVKEKIQSLDNPKAVKYPTLRNSLLIIKFDRYEVMRNLGGGSSLSNKSNRKILYAEDLSIDESRSYTLVAVIMHSGNSPHNNDGSYYCRLKLGNQNYLYQYKDGITPNYPCDEWPVVQELLKESCNSKCLSGCKWCDYKRIEQANAHILVYLLKTAVTIENSSDLNSYRVNTINGMMKFRSCMSDV